MSTKIKYNGSVVATVEGGNTATLPIKDKKMKSDIVITVPEAEGEVIPEFTEVEDFTVFLDEADEGTITVAYSTPQDVKLSAPSGSAQTVRLASVDDENFIPSNIKKGVSIFGMIGNYEGEGGATPTQEKGVNITENGTTEVLPDAGYALSKVTINANVKQNYCLVRFYNDDRTTLLYEIVVPYGSSAVYAGETPTSSLGAGYTFTGFEPSTANVTADLDCYAVYEEPYIPEVGTLESTSWADISAVSAAGTAANYFAVGDTKAVTLNGQVGADLTLTNATYYVYILGFNHNSAKEGNGITFGTFKTAASGGTDICLVGSAYGTEVTDGTKCFNRNHWGLSNLGGWASCDMRYDILGSTDVAPSGYGAARESGNVGYDATATCATNPVANTLMAALPADLRAVMKPMSIFSNNVGDFNDNETKITVSVDYLPLLAEFEIRGERQSASQYEQNHQAQYDYFKGGASKIKYCHSSTETAAQWGWRSAVFYGTSDFCAASRNGSGTNNEKGSIATGVAPIFRV
jgi:hypothetical protein